MAVRNFLAKHKLNDFKNWLIKDGWQIEDHSQNIYAVLRARKATRRHPLIVYEKDKSSTHYTVQSRDFGVVYAWLKKGGGSDE